MKVVVDYFKSRKGLFVWTEYKAASNLDDEVDSFNASLIFDITREKKLRVWFPFWDGLFEEMRNDKSPENINIQAIGKRWFQIKEQAQDSGVNRINTWLNQEDSEILRARAVLCRGGHNAEALEHRGESVLRDHYGLEGIDVYCDKSCYTFDESKKGSHM
jgi:hypothetical protein